MADGEAGRKEAHGAEDMLLASTLFALKDDPSLLRRAQRCQVCGNAITPMEGFVRRLGDHFHREPAPAKKTQVHVGRDRRRKGAASGVLYARELIQESGDSPVLFEAEVAGDEDVIEVLSDALDESAGDDESDSEDATVLNVGSAVSRGLGRCRVMQFAPAPERQALAGRVASLNDRWNEVSRAEEEKDEDKALVTLTLRTPSFFVDDWLEAEMSPGGTHLLQAATEQEEAHAEALRSMEKVHQIARPFRLKAWNGLAGFPHATDQGLEAGSVLVFQAPSPESQVLSDGLLEALTHLEHSGVGLRRELGFGDVVVCDPVHTEVHEHTGLSAG